MVAAKDLKGRTVLDDSQIAMVSLVLFALRKSTDQKAQLSDVNYLRDSLAALAIAGYAVVPQGSLDAVFKSVTDLFTELEVMVPKESGHMQVEGKGL